MPDFTLKTAQILAPDNERLSIRAFSNFDYTPRAPYRVADSAASIGTNGDTVTVFLDVLSMEAGDIVFFLVAHTANQAPPHPTITGSIASGNGTLTLIGEQETESNGDIAKLAFFYYEVAPDESGSISVEFSESLSSGELAVYAQALAQVKAPDAFVIGPPSTYTFADVETPAVPGSFTDALVLRAALVHDGSSWSEAAGHEELVDTWVTSAGFRRQRFTLQAATEPTSDPIDALTIVNFGPTDVGFGATFVFNNQPMPDVDFPPPNNGSTSQAFFQPSVDPSPVCAVRLTAPATETWISHTIEARIAIDTEAPEEQFSVWRLYYERSEANLSPSSPYVEAVVRHQAGDVEGILRPRFARFQISTDDYFPDGDASMANVNLHFVLECRTTDPRHTVPPTQRLGVRDDHCAAVVFGVTAPLNGS